jgi:hypothetical protein
MAPTALRAANTTSGSCLTEFSFMAAGALNDYFIRWIENGKRSIGFAHHPFGADS